ncbi:hypothetical protein BKA93DRAFT_867912 [Sparassis latifolia]
MHCRHSNLPAECCTYRIRRRFVVMSPRLPQELIDQVIDHLWDDRASLEACSTSCHAWLSSSRTHLFHTIELSTEHQCYHLNLLLEASPNIAGYVKKLALLLSLQFEFMQRIRTPSPPDYGVPRYSSWVISVITKLWRLDDLEFRRSHWDVFSHPEPQRIIKTVVAKLKRLVFSEMFLDMADVECVLGAARRLEELRFDRVNWTPWMPRIRGALPLSSTLQHLILDSTFSQDAILRTLLFSMHEHQIKLRTLCLEHIYESDIKSLGSILRASGAFVERLLLGGDVVEAVSRDEISLASYISLRALYLGTVHLELCHQHDYGAWMSTLLS